MTQNINNVTTGYFSKFKSVEVTCSCTKCDSLFCFSKRHAVASCSCENCKESKTCLFYNNGLVPSKRDAVGSCSCENCKESKSCLFYNNRLPFNETQSDTVKTVPNVKTSATGNNVRLSKTSYNVNPSATDHTTTSSTKNSKVASVTGYNVIPTVTDHRVRISATGSPVVPSVTGYSTVSSETRQIVPPMTGYNTMTSETRQNVVPPLTRATPPKCCSTSVTGYNTMSSETHQNVVPSVTGYSTVSSETRQIMPSMTGYNTMTSETHQNVVPSVTRATPPKCCSTSVTGYNTMSSEIHQNVVSSVTGYSTVSSETRQIMPSMTGYNTITSETCQNVVPPLTRATPPKCCSTSVTGYNTMSSETHQNVVPSVTGYSTVSSETRQIVPSLTGYNTLTSETRQNDVPSWTSENVQSKHTYTSSRYASTATSNTYKTSKDTSELCRNMLGTTRYNLDDLKNIYLSHKRPPPEPPSYTYKQEPYFSETPKTEATSYTLDICRSVLGMQKNAIESLKHIYLPHKNSEDCDCSELSKSAGYVLDFANLKPSPKTTSECCVHILDTEWNTIETPGNTYLSKNCNCAECVANKPEYITEIPGYIVELPVNNQTIIKNAFLHKSQETRANKIEQLKKIFSPHAKSCKCRYGKNTNKPSKNNIQICMNVSGTPAYNTESPESPRSRSEPRRRSHDPKRNKKCSELCKNILNIQKDTIETLESIYLTQKKTCSCNEALKNKPTKCSPETAPELEKKNCHCDDTQKNQSDDPGYVFDVPKYIENQDRCGCKETATKKSGSPKYATELQKCTHKKDSKNNCNCDGTSKNKPDLPGYTFDVPKYTENPDTCGCKETATKKSDSPKYATELQNCTHKKDSKNNCNCDGTSKTKSDLPGYTFDVPKYTENPDTCGCKETATKKSDSPKYATELQKCTHKKDSKNNCNCDGTSKNKSDLPGYTFDVPKYIENQDTCGCKNTAMKKSDSPKYATELQKCTHKKDSKNNCNCDGTSKTKSDLPGYTFDVPKYTENPDTCGCKETATKKSDSPKYATELQNCTHKKDSKNNCNCDGTSKNKTDLPGYTFDVPKYIENQDTCGCKNTATKKSDSPKYATELQKCTHKKDSKNNCNCDGTSKTKSDLPGYTFDVPKYTENPDTCGCKETATKKSDSPKYATELQNCTHKKDSKNNCNCDGTSKNKSDLPGYTFDVPKYIENQDTCGCKNTATKKSDSPKYATELQKCTHKKDSKNNCNCDGTSKTKSDLPGYTFDVPKYTENPDTCGCKETATKESDSPKYATELQKCTHKKDSKNNCNCDGTSKTKSDLPGYTFDVPKYTENPDTCGCKETATKKSDSPKYATELQNCTHKKDSKNNCNCDGTSKNKSDLPGYTFDVPKYIENQDTCGCKNTATKKSDSPKYATELQKCTHKKDSKNNCNCDGTSKTKSDLPGYTFDVPKYTENPDTCGCKETATKESDSPKYATELQKCTHKKDSKNNCNCDGTSKNKSDLPGYTFDVPKYTENPDTCGCKETATKKSDSPKYATENNCNYDGTSKIKSDLPGYTFDVPKYTGSKEECGCKEAPTKKSNSPEYALKLQKCTHKKDKNENCNCDDTSKNKSDSPGYVFAVPKHTEPKEECGCKETWTKKPDSPKYVLESQKCFHKKDQKENCNFDATSKNDSNSPGYVFDVPKYTESKEECGCKEAPTKKSNSPEYALKLQKCTHKKDKNENCNCDDTSKNKSDSPGYVFAVPKHTEPKEECGCKETWTKKPDSPKYVLESQKCFHKKDQKENCIFDATSKNDSNSPGYLFDVPKYTEPKEECGCKEAPTKKSNSPEYALKLQKCTHKKDKNENCNCDDTSKNKSDSPGYVFDVPKHTEPKEGCGCKVTWRKKSDSPKYVLESQKCFHKKDQKENCNFDATSKNDSNSPGYVFDVPKHTEPKEECGCKVTWRKKSDSLKYVLESQKCFHKKDNCNLDASSKNDSNSAGYVFDVPKNTEHKEKCGCRETPTKKSDSPEYALELQKCTHKKVQKKDCSCDDMPKTKSDTQRYILDLQKRSYKLTKNTQELLKSILETQHNKIETLNKYDKKNNCETLNNKDKKKHCHCNDKRKSKSDSPGYVFELQKYKAKPNEALKKSCECAKESRKNRSNSRGYVYELDKYKTSPLEILKRPCECKQKSISNEHANNAQIFSLDRLEKMKNTIDKLIKTCECNELQKNKCESPGCVEKYCISQEKINKDTLEIQKNTEQKCECKESKKRSSQPSGYEISKETRELFKSIFQTQGETIESMNNTYHLEKKDICNNCNELPECLIEKNTFDTTIEAPCNTCIPDEGIYECDGAPQSLAAEKELESTSNAQQLYKSIASAQKNNIELLKSIYLPHQSLQHTATQQESIINGMCKSLSGIQTINVESLKKLYLPQQSQSNTNGQKTCKNITDNMKNKIELLKSIYLPYKTESTTNAYQISKSVSETQKNKIELNQSPMRALEICQSILGDQEKKYEMIKSIYVPQKNKQQKNTFEICKNSLGIRNKTVESLKNIYIPPRYTLDYTKKYEYPDIYNSTRNISSDQTVQSRKEIMPCEASVASKQSVSNKSSKLSKYDIFKRIKEAYRACSCKVCECIAGKSAKNPLCKCKPCDCIDCMSFLKNDRRPSSEHEGAPSKRRCIRCNIIQCERLTLGKRHICDCNPCDCIKCSGVPAKVCKCAPCQCVECKSMTIHQPQTLVVAPVGETVQRVACTCSPCDCIECGPVYPLGSTVVHEVSTGTNALCRCELCQNEACDQTGVDPCKCQRRNKALIKPVEKDTHDYDIRTATIIHNKHVKRDDIKRNMRHDTIAMFAAVPRNYPTFASKNSLSNTKTCNCDECECITCVCKEEAYNSIKSSQLFSTHKTLTISDLNVRLKSKLNSSNNCKCKPCECEICEKFRNDNLLVSSRTSWSQGKSCVCDTCDCLSCEEQAEPPKYSFNNLCKCNLCECTHCESKMTKSLKRHGRLCRCSICRYERCFADEMSSNAIVHPIKKGDFFTPSIHQNKFQSLILKKQNFGEPSSSIRKVSSNKDCSSKIRDASLCHALLKHESPSKQLSEFNTSIEMGSITQEINDINDFSTTQTLKCESLKYDAYMQYQDCNKEKKILKNNSIDNEVSGSNFSGYSSFDTSPKTSCHKDYGSITPISRNKNKSWESSCNSSGHDYPEYLIRFPKSTVETCLKDVMELDMGNTIKIDKFDIIPSSAVHHVNKEYENILCEEKRLEMRDCNLIHSCYSKLIVSNRTDSVKQYKMESNYNGTNNFAYIPCDHDFMDTANPGNFKIDLSNSLNVDLNKQNNRVENKTLHNNEKKQLQGRGCMTESIFNIKSENTKYFNGLQHFNDYHITRKVFDFNVAEQNTTGPSIHNNRSNTWKYSKDSDSDSKGVTLNIDEDYKRVQKTLKEAKEFSVELMRLLEMYERANKEFESISEKLKSSHGSILSGDSNLKKGFSDIEKCIVRKNRCSKIEHELHEIPLEVPSVREKITSTSILQYQAKISEKLITDDENETKITLQKTLSCKSIINHEKDSDLIAEDDPSSYKFKNNLLEEIESHLDKDGIFCNSSEKEQVIANQDCTIQDDKKLIAKKDLFHANEQILAVPDRGIRKKERINSKNYKKYSNLLKRTIIISKRISIKNSGNNESKQVNKYCVAVGPSTTFVSDTNTKTNFENTNSLPVNISLKDTEEENQKQKRGKYDLNQIIRKLDTVFGSIKEMSVSTSTDTHGLEKTLEEYDLENSSINHELEETKPWPILKKNLYWNSKPFTKSKEVCIFPSMDLQIKQAVQSISLQTTQPKKKIIPHHENKALANLQAEVKKLLDMPILQPQTHIDHYADSIKESFKSNLEMELKETTKLSLETNRKDVNNVDEEPCSSSAIRDLVQLSALLPIIEKKMETDCSNRNSESSSQKSTMECASVIAQIRGLLDLSFLLPYLKMIPNKNSGTASPIMLDIPSTSRGLARSALWRGPAHSLPPPPPFGMTDSADQQRARSDDSLKVEFLAVRRVSDYTVLVKWNTPKDLTRVKGYELLVDGRAVRKILSPSKNLAVVTCLPHTDKVLLTIRTITKDVSVTGHYPNTTIIYRPCVK